MIGKWKYDDGRMIEFLPDGNYQLTPANGDKAVITDKLFLKENEGTVQMTMTMLFEPICIIKRLDDQVLIYTSLDINGPPVDRKLAKL